MVGRLLYTFALSCTVGVFWEFAELASDVVLHTDIQKNVRETMSDLVADATGAATTLVLLVIISRLWPRDRN